MFCSTDDSTTDDVYEEDEEIEEAYEDAYYGDDDWYWDEYPSYYDDDYYEDEYWVRPLYHACDLSKGLISNTSI